MEQNEANTAVQEQAPAHLVDTTQPVEAPIDTVPTLKETTQGQVEQERPQWLPEKFKSPEDLAKSYAELEKKITTRVPEKYDWSVTKEFNLGDVTPEMDAEISQVFKKAGFTQDQVKTALALYSDQLGKIQGELQTAPMVDIQAEAQTLEKQWGKDYQARLESVRKYAGTLPERVLNLPLIDTAEGIQFLETLMEGNRMPNPITNTRSAPMQDINTVREEIRNMRADEKFKLPPGDQIGEVHRQRLYNLYETLDRLEKKGN